MSDTQPIRKCVFVDSLIVKKYFNDLFVTKDGIPAVMKKDIKN